MAKGAEILGLMEFSSRHKEVGGNHEIQAQFLGGQGIPPKRLGEPENAAGLSKGEVVGNLNSAKLTDSF